MSSPCSNQQGQIHCFELNCCCLLLCCVLTHDSSVLCVHSLGLVDNHSVLNYACGVCNALIVMVWPRENAHHRVEDVAAHVGGVDGRHVLLLIIASTDCLLKLQKQGCDTVHVGC